MDTFTYNGHICIDCAMWWANNDDTALNADEAQAFHDAKDKVAALNIIVGDEYADFSSLDCDGCGSYLAGSRHNAVITVETF